MKRVSNMAAGALYAGLAIALSPFLVSAYAQQSPNQTQGGNAPQSASQAGAAGQSNQQGQQGQPQGQPQPGQETQPGQQPGEGQTPTLQGPKIDPMEEAAYKAFYDLPPTDFDQTIKLGEDFVQKYPNSRYVEAVYSRLTQAYFAKNQVDKMYAAGDKALGLNPDDIDVLSLVGWVIPHSYDPDDPDAQRRLDRAEEYSKHAIELLSTMQKPPEMTDEDFAKIRDSKLAQSYAGLGLVYFRRGNYADSVTELQKATQTDPTPDPTDYYVIGINLSQLKRFDDAAQAFDKCSQMEGSLQERCKQGEAQAKKAAASLSTPSKP
jgi:tetratricopeptide (TPR) repeat protein